MVMSYQGRNRSFDYAQMVKTGFLVGVGLFAIGAFGEILGHKLFASLPAVVTQVLFGMEVLGILLALFVPIIFGAVLPLTE